MLNENIPKILSVHDRMNTLQMHIMNNMHNSYARIFRMHIMTGIVVCLLEKKVGNIFKKEIDLSAI